MIIPLGPLRPITYFDHGCELINGVVYNRLALEWIPAAEMFIGRNPMAGPGWWSIILQWGVRGHTGPGEGGYRHNIDLSWFCRLTILARVSRW